MASPPCPSETPAATEPQVLSSRLFGAVVAGSESLALRLRAIMEGTDVNYSAGSPRSTVLGTPSGPPYLGDMVAREYNVAATAPDEPKQRQLGEEHLKQQLREVRDAAEQLELQAVQAALSLSKLKAASLADCPENFKCPITLSIMEEPTILAQSAQTYEKEALASALASRPGVDPLTNARFEGPPQLIRNIALGGSIDQWRASLPGGDARRATSHRVARPSAAAGDAVPGPVVTPSAPAPTTATGGWKHRVAAGAFSLVLGALLGVICSGNEAAVVDSPGFPVQPLSDKCANKISMGTPWYAGGWTRVRHVPAGMTWHPARDRLAGWQVYGKEGVDSASWSVTFASKVPNYDQFLFATGDCEKWLVANKNDVIGAYYANSPRLILASSLSSSSYVARWYNRHDFNEDPWVSLNDHFPAIEQGNILYGEDNFGQDHAAEILPWHDGADVYIRATGESSDQQGQTQGLLRGHVPREKGNSTGN